MNTGYLPTPPRYDKLKETHLWQRLDQSTDSEVKELAVKVDKAARAIVPLSNDVIRYMPLYTLHNERHILNVIGWMERLLGADGLAALSPLESALAILSAYVHDLGMTLSAEEHREISDEGSASKARQDYVRFSDRFLDERYLIERLRQQGQKYRADLIEGHLLAEFLRTTHADDRSERIRRRLDEVKRDVGDSKLFEYRRLSFRDALGFIATSHNQSVTWLREQTARELGGFWTTVGNSEPVNYGFIGLLLRLGDIMDFDASRTPTILFHHIGLDLDLATRFEEISRKEWQKHLSITGVDWPEDGRLTYRSHQCPHPAVEKSIRHFVGWIREEISGARAELSRLQREMASESRCRLLLPEDVAVDIWPERRNGQPVYEYHDWRFELDQEEILRLLMGESLYGDPNVCIRELLQNALDAVELRDLRLQLMDRGGQPCQPPDGVSLRPGWFKFSRDQEEFEVRLTWGEEDGHQFVRVEDNGVGMSADIVQRHFTQIGKSYYRSPEFRREQSEMRAKGLLLSPVSEFGIGVLSCFMIAERVSVRTHPGTGQDRRPIDLEISGPGSLFWTKPGTRQRQGTEVTLWLRKSNKGEPIVFEEDWEVCQRELRREFRYEQSNDELKGLAVGVIAAAHVVWPKYPISIQNWKHRIDDRFHLDYLSPLSTHQLIPHAKDEGISEDRLGQVTWAAYEWVDNEGSEATESRVRLWFPQHIAPTSVNDLPVDPPAGSAAIPFWELAFLVEKSLGRFADLRTLTLVGGIRVVNNVVLVPELPLCHGVGTRVWVDFRGNAKPRLSVNRLQALPSPDWRDVAGGVLDRWVAALLKSVPDRLGSRRNLLLFSWQNRETISRIESELPGSAKLIPATSGRRMEDVAILSRSFLQAIALDETLAPNLSYCTRLLARDGELAANIRPSLRGLPVSANGEYRTLVLSVARALGVDLRRFPEGAPVADPHLRLQSQAEILQHAYFPDLARSWPVLDLFPLEGRIGDTVLTAPGSFNFELHGRRVEFADPTGKQPELLVRLGYDLCFPMSSIPLGRLRKGFPIWREDRRCRTVGVLPFLFPDSVEDWAKNASGILNLLPGMEYLYAFSPTFDLWFKDFTEWTHADWQHSDNRSYLWTIGSGEVLVAQGAISHEEMRERGSPYTSFLAGLRPHKSS